MWQTDDAVGQDKNEIRSIHDLIGRDVHTKKYHCKACDAKSGKVYFSFRKDAVKRHLRMVHTKDQEVQCSSCLRYYKNANTRDEHQRRHCKAYKLQQKRTNASYVIPSLKK